MSLITELLIATLLVGGGFFSAAAGLGILRMPDIMIRMHASTKAGTLGTGLILAALAVYFGDLSTASRAVAAILFLLITAPVAAHMIGRAAYRIGTPLWEGNVVDEWQARGPTGPGTPLTVGQAAERRADGNRDTPHPAK